MNLTDKNCNEHNKDYVNSKPQSRLTILLIVQE